MSTLDLRHFLRTVRANAQVVLIVAVVCGLVAGLFVSFREPVYRAHTRIRVEPIVDPVLNDLQGSTSITVQPDMNTEVQIAQSRPIATSVRETLLGTGDESLVNELEQMTPQALLQSLTVEAVRDTTVIEITYEDPNPLHASRIANEFAKAYLAARKKQIETDVQGFLTPIADELELLENDYATKLEAVAKATDPFTKGLLQADAIQLSESMRVLTAKETQMNLLKDTSAGGRVVATATVPEQPTGPSTPAAIALGLILGALLGSGVTIVRQLVVDRVARQEEIEEHLGAPVIGVIPAVPGWTERLAVHLITREDPASHVSEAYRTLGTNVRFAASRQPLNILLVTSALPEEGKSATATNLAMVLAQSGLRTILVDADLRRPRAGQFLDVPPGPGFREALEGWRELVDVIQVSEVPGLAVLRSGDTPPDPASLLSGPDVERVFAELRKAAEFIVCDAPPVLPVADASILAAKADGVLFVHDPSISPKTALVEAVRQLRTSGGQVIGGVHNNVTKSQRTYLGYARYETYYGSRGGQRTTDLSDSDGLSRRPVSFPPMPGDQRGRDLERSGRRERRS
jgi:capsular exopolysaccharide synthesis family protein